MQFRKDIQGLRAFAFLLVFIFHLNSSWLPGGFIGVDIFFVISRYLITSIILKQKVSDEFNFINFYKKRIQRIIPAQLVLILIVILLAFKFYLFSDIQNFKKWAISSALYFSNFIFASGDSYFGTKSNENPLLHTWSLSIEMQFYLFLPILLLYSKTKYLKYILFSIIIILLSLTTYLIIFLEKNQLYYSLPARIPEFLIGSLCYIQTSKKSLTEWKSTLLSCIGYIFIIGTAVFWKEYYTFPGLTTLIPCIGACFLLISSKNPISKILENRASLLIGELSYSLYLWHWPIMAFVRYSNDRYLFTIQEIILITICTFIAAYLSYVFIEKKFRFKNDVRFLIVFAPLLTIVLYLSYNLSKLTKYKELPAEYSKPLFGTKSHASGIPEKLGDTTKNSSILLIGDSNALVLKKFFDYLGQKNKFSFWTITTNTYPPIKGLKAEELKQDLINPNQFHDFNLAQRDSEITQKYIDSSDIIILNCTRFDRIPSEIQAIIDLANNLKASQKLILIHTFPKLDRNPIRLNHGIIKKELIQYNIISSAIPKEIVEISKIKSNVFIYDISKSNIFKKSNIPYNRDTITYYDKNHLNDYGSKLLAIDLATDFSYFWSKNIK